MMTETMTKPIVQQPGQGRALWHLGALINFILGRHWSFVANDEAVRGQAIRYAAVSAVSLLLNSLGVYLLTDYLKIHYVISKVIIAFLVGILFNFPLHRSFVFRRHTYA